MLNLICYGCFYIRYVCLFLIKKAQKFCLESEASAGDGEMLLVIVLSCNSIFPGASLVTPKKVSVFQLPHSTSAVPVKFFENVSLELFNTKVTSPCLQLLVSKSQLSKSPLPLPFLPILYS